MTNYEKFKDDIEHARNHHELYTYLMSMHKIKITDCYEALDFFDWLSKEYDEPFNCEFVPYNIDMFGGNSTITIGKIYKVVDGHFTNDKGKTYPICKELRSEEDLHEYLGSDGDFTFGDIKVVVLK